MTPLRREGSSEEIANTVACLASSETSFITGANIDINGGFAIFIAKDNSIANMLKP